MTNKIRIKLGPIEFEAEGDSELIEREREQFLVYCRKQLSLYPPLFLRRHNF